MLFGCLVVLAFPVGHSCVGIGGDAIGIASAELLQERQHFADIGVAVDAHGEEVTRKGVKEVEDALTEHVVAVGGTDGETEHDGKLFPFLLHRFLCGFDGLTGILYIEDGLNEEGIHAAVDECIYLLAVGGFERVFIQSRLFACAHACGFAGRTDAAQDIAGFFFCGEVIGCLACQFTSGEIDVAHMVFQSIVGQRDALGIERIGFDKVGTCL